MGGGEEDAERGKECSPSPSFPLLLLPSAFSACWCLFCYKVRLGQSCCWAWLQNDAGVKTWPKDGSRKYNSLYESVQCIKMPPWFAPHLIGKVCFKFYLSFLCPSARARVTTLEECQRRFLWWGVTPWERWGRQHPSSLSLFTGKISRPQKRGGELVWVGKAGHHVRTVCRHWDKGEREAGRGGREGGGRAWGILKGSTKGEGREVSRSSDSWQPPSMGREEGHGQERGKRRGFLHISGKLLSDKLVVKLCLTKSLYGKIVVKLLSISLSESGIMSKGKRGGKGLWWSSVPSFPCLVL